MKIGNIYLQNVIKEFQSQKLLADKTMQRMLEEQLHWQPNKESNSMAILVQHMHGNMQSRWINFLTEDGEKIGRKRDAEFEDQQFSKENLLSLWEVGWSTLFNSLNQLNDKDLSKTVYIREQPLIVIEAINRQLTHYSYHVGQIVLLGKSMIGTKWESLSIPRKTAN